VTTIPFALSTYQRDRAFVPPQTLLNLIVEKDASASTPAQVMLLQRPGLERVATVPGSVQALYSTAGGAAGTYAIAADALYSIDDGATTLIGEMSGTASLSRIRSNFDRLCIVNGPLVYLYGATKTSTANTFRNIPIPDGYLAADVTTLDAYFVVAMEDGTFFWLVPGDDAFDPLNFATAESDPDGLVACSVLGGNLFLFGARTIEVWQTTGTADAPFQRVSGQSYQRGCLSRDSVVATDNTLVWVGDDGKVYRVGNVPERLSTDGIEEHIRLRSGDPSAWAYSYDGHSLYVLRVPGRGTFAYDFVAQTWSEFGSEGHAFWRPIVGTQTDDGILCGDSESGAIWRLADVSADDGDILRRRASATIIVQGKPVRLDNVVLDIGSEAPCDWRLRWSDGDEILADQPWVTLRARAGADTLTYYRLGQCLAPYRTFELEVTDPVAIRMSGGRTGEAWR
jgi:hypothetical protein